MKYKIGLLALILTLVLMGCATAPAATPQPVFTQAPAANNPARTAANVVASGVVKPSQEARLSFAQGGWVQNVQVSVGDQVQAGDLIAQLEGKARLEAAITGAQTELLAAQQAFKNLDENAGMARVEAFQAIIRANQVLGDAKYRLYNYTVPAKLADREPMQALELTKDNLDQAREAFEPYKHKSSSDEVRADLKEALDRAQSEYRAAMRWVELEADLIAAQASLEDAQLTYEKLADGPEPDQVAMAQARLDNAQAQLVVAQAALDQLDLRAPFDGMVVSVEICASEAVLPGQVVVVLGDLDHLQVETSDLSERDVSAVAVGQPAMVFVEALDLEIPGLVASIAPQADTIGGDVVYAVAIELEEQPDGLRWGMSVDVEIDTE
jgi:multidrug efflux pump subunit AcrA (membrane-fusion protein)